MCGLMDQYIMALSRQASCMVMASGRVQTTTAMRENTGTIKSMDWVYISGAMAKSVVDSSDKTVL